MVTNLKRKWTKKPKVSNGKNNKILLFKISRIISMIYNKDEKKLKNNKMLFSMKIIKQIALIIKNQIKKKYLIMRNQKAY